MVTLLLKDFGVVKREDIKSKEVFQEDPSCRSALAKVSALNVSNSARRAGVLQLMKGDALHDGSVISNVVQQMEITGAVTKEQAATQKKNLVHKKPLHTRDLVKICILPWLCEMINTPFL